MPPLATHYDQRAHDQRVTALQRRLYSGAQAATSTTRPALEMDDWSNLAALSVCRGLAASGPPAAALVDGALRSRGIIDPPPRMLIAAVSSNTPLDELAAEFAPRIARALAKGQFLRIGIGDCLPLRVPGRRFVVVLLLRGALRLVAPLPRVVALGRRVSVRLRAPSAGRNLALVIATPAGAVERHAFKARGAELRASVRFSQRGRYRVELTGEGAHGPEVLANIPIDVGQPAPSALLLGGRSQVTKGDHGALARVFFERANAFRRQRGLKPWVADQRLAAVARAYSEEMRAYAFVGHRSPRTGGPADRVRRAGIRALVVRENLARAYSVVEAFDQLVASPAHLDNLVSTDVESTGIGIAVEGSAGDRALLVTQLLARLAPPFDAAAAPAQALAHVNGQRWQAKVAPLVEHRELSTLARAYLQQQRTDLRAADRWLQQQLQSLGARYRQVRGLLLSAGAVEAIAGAVELRSADARYVGLAVEQRKDRIAIFVLIAVPR